MFCLIVDLFCFFVERKKLLFFFILQIFPIKLLGLRLSSGLKVQNYKGGFHVWQQLFCFRENVPGTRGLEKKKIWVLSGGPRKEFGSAFPPLSFLDLFFGSV